MEISENTKNVGERIIPIIFKHYNVPIERLYESRGTAKHKLARMCVYLILHKEYGISIRQISLLTRKGARNIQRCISKLKYQVEHFEDCIEEYDILLDEIKEKAYR